MAEINIAYEGQVLKEVRAATQVELDGVGWDEFDSLTVLVFESGLKIYPSRDPEGNGPGMMFGELPNGHQFYVTE